MYQRSNSLKQSAILLLLIGIFCCIPELIIAEESPGSPLAAEVQDNRFSRPFFNNEKTPVSAYSDSSQISRVEEKLKQTAFLETGDSFSVEGDEQSTKVNRQTAVATARGNSARISQHLQDIRNQAKARTASSRPERIRRPQH